MSGVVPHLRPHRDYDPRLRELVFQTGHVSIARDCDVPRSTYNEWKKGKFHVVSTVHGGGPGNGVGAGTPWAWCRGFASGPRATVGKSAAPRRARPFVSTRHPDVRTPWCRRCAFVAGVRRAMTVSRTASFVLTAPLPASTQTETDDAQAVMSGKMPSHRRTTRRRVTSTGQSTSPGQGQQ